MGAFCVPGAGFIKTIYLKIVLLYYVSTKNETAYISSIFIIFKLSVYMLYLELALSFSFGVSWTNNFP